MKNKLHLGPKQKYTGEGWADSGKPNRKLRNDKDYTQEILLDSPLFGDDGASVGWLTVFYSVFNKPEMWAVHDNNAERIGTTSLTENPGDAGHCDDHTVRMCHGTKKQALAAVDAWVKQFLAKIMGGTV